MDLMLVVIELDDEFRPRQAFDNLTLKLQYSTFSGHKKYINPENILTDYIPFVKRLFQMPAAVACIKKPPSCVREGKYMSECA